MKYKLHGNHNNRIVLHGGPGAIGSAAGLCQTIENCVELYSYGKTIEVQLLEIDEVIKTYDMKAPILIGHSWGAWLAYIYASKHPVSKIILIGCGPFHRKYLSGMNQSRMDRLTPEEQVQVQGFFQALSQGQEVTGDAFGRLMAKMDSYAMDTYSDKVLEFDMAGHEALMAELNDLRTSGQLLEMGRSITSEIAIIHGKDDPHPYAGILEPFDSIQLQYDHHLLDRCGHTPWNERYAKGTFKDILSKALKYTFRSQRLGFRMFQPEDKPAFFEMNHDPEVMAYFPSTLSRQASDDFLERIITNHQKDGFGLYCVEILDSGDFIGFIGLSRPNFDADFMPCIEIGWRLKKTYWHKGYASEGAKRVLKYAFENLRLDEIVSFTALQNLPSIQVMKRIGMAYEKNFCHPKVKGTVLEEHVLYRIHKNDF